MKFSWSLDLNGARFHNLPQCSIFVQLNSAESREQHGATREMVTLSSFRFVSYLSVTFSCSVNFVSISQISIDISIDTLW